MFELWQWQQLFSDWRVFAAGLGQTILASGLALVLSLVLGVFMGLFALVPLRALRWLNRVYVEVFQNTPLLVQTFFLYYGLPHAGITLPVLAVGVIALGVYTGAYIAEIVRAGVQAIPKGQYEAAYSQGFGYWATMRHIILPQAIRVALPPLTNQVVNLVKNSQILALIPGYDLMYQADSWTQQTLLYQPGYVTVAVLYLCLTLPLAHLARKLERMVARGRAEEVRPTVARASGSVPA